MRAVAAGVGKGVVITARGREDIALLYAVEVLGVNATADPCRCYMKMSWGNCSVKVSCPHGDFHDEPQGTAAGRPGQSCACEAHYQSRSRQRSAAYGPPGPTPQAPLPDWRRSGAAAPQPRAALAAPLAGEARRQDCGAHDDYLRRL